MNSYLSFNSQLQNGPTVWASHYAARSLSKTVTETSPNLKGLQTFWRDGRVRPLQVAGEG